MTPRFDEVGVELEPHEISLVQSAYVECDATRQSPINPETNASEPIGLTTEQVNRIGLVVLVGATEIRLNAPRFFGAKLLHPFEVKAAREKADHLENFYHAIHNTLEVSKQKLTGVEFVN